MKKLTLCLACSILFFSPAFAQEIEWQNTIGGSNSDAISCILQASDGGFVFGGFSISNISGDKTENSNGSWDYWIIKTTASGTMLWQNTIGGNNWDELTSIYETYDGGYILGGHSQSNISGDKTENSLGGWDYWIIKIDASGNILWQNTIGGNCDDKLSSVQQTSDHGYILCGYSCSDSLGDKTENCKGGYDFWMVKTDSLGNILWQNTIGGSNPDYLYSIAQTNDGGYILGGASTSGISFDKTEGCYGLADYWVIKTDSTGNIQWQNTIGGNDDDQLFSLQQTVDYGYILGGYSSSNISGDKLENSIDGSTDYWILKTDSLGIIQWQNTIGGSGNDLLHAVQQTNDNDYFASGYSNSNISGDKTENPLYGNFNDYWIVRIDSLGNIYSDNTIGGNVWDELSAAIITMDDGYILGGRSISNISGDKTENSIANSTDYWIVKLIGNSNFIIGKNFIDINSNQVQDANEPGLNAIKIAEQNTGWLDFSDQNGFYSVSILDSGNYTVMPTAINYYNTVPVSHSAYFNGIQQTDSLNDFAFQPAGVFNDLCVTITPLGNFRAGMNASYMINYGNYGTTTLAPTVIFFPYFNVSYISASVTPTSVAPDSVVWALPALAPFQTGSIVVTVNVNTGLPIGTLINSSVRIEPVAGDANTTCNYHSWEVYTTGAVDPNDIIVSDDTLTTVQLAAAPYLDYIIRFQNTGNDTAFTAKILNPIDTFKLDLNSFEFVNASHPVNLNWINYQRNMEFKFENILLPDSNINEPMSHGFVHYRIKPKTTLFAGDSVTNFAAIYFDFNAPVITNTAITRIILPTGLAQLAGGNGQLAVYPNPAGKELTVGNLQFAKSQTLKVFDLYGRVVFEKLISSANCTLQIANWPSGIYFIQAGELRGKFVKE